MSSSLYEILGLTPTCTEAEIKKAFKVLAIELHPDKNPHPNAGYEFGALRDAYNCLIDPRARKEYDAKHFIAFPPETREAFSNSGAPKAEKLSKSLRKQQEERQAREEKIARREAVKPFKCGNGKKGASEKMDQRDRYHFVLEKKLHNLKTLREGGKSVRRFDGRLIKEDIESFKASRDKGGSEVILRREDKLVGLTNALVPTKPLRPMDIHNLRKEELALSRKDRAKKKAEEKKAVEVADQKRMDEYKSAKAAALLKNPTEQWASHLDRVRNAEQEKEARMLADKARREANEAKHKASKQLYSEWSRQEKIRLSETKGRRDQIKAEKRHQKLISRDDMDDDDWLEIEVERQVDEEFKLLERLGLGGGDVTLQRGRKMRNQAAAAIAGGGMPKCISYVSSPSSNVARLPDTSSETAEETDGGDELTWEELNSFWAQRYCKEFGIKTYPMSSSASSTNLNNGLATQAAVTPPSNILTHRAHLESTHHASALAFTKSKLLQYSIDSNNPNTQLDKLRPLQPIIQPPMPSLSEMEEAGFVYFRKLKNGRMDILTGDRVAKMRESGIGEVEMVERVGLMNVDCFGDGEGFVAPVGKRLGLAARKTGKSGGVKF